MDLRKIGKRRVATVLPEMTVRDAARVMREAHLGDVIVVEQRDQKVFPVGILTDRDIVMSTTALGVSPVDFLVGDVMTRNLVTAGSHEPLNRVIDLMKEHGVKRIPIVSPDGELDGIVSIEDVMRLLSEEMCALSQVYERQRANEAERRRKVS